ncbi:CpaF family protein [Candidatus Micrarchaeota archaeon]|nr:CpaF family protein [Candidatus Micrarchaeota archaeon]
MRNHTNSNSTRLPVTPSLQSLLEDDLIEEIMINGFGGVFVFHRQNGMMKTGVSPSDSELEKLSSFLLGNKKSHGIADVRLEDGSRANIILSSTGEPSITIRKFRKKPFSIRDLVAEGTLSSDLAAFLWVCTDGFGLFPANIVIAGGTAAGKTTTLNALSSFIPASQRIITLEDVRELNLWHENWVKLETDDKRDLSMLVKNSLRMRPDRIILGDVRGEDAKYLFTAMNTGHRGCFATLHANSDRETILRLEGAPMNVPRSLIPLIDLIIVQHRVFYKRSGRLKRRITQVSEVSSIEENVIALNELYKWIPGEDRIIRTPLISAFKERLSSASGVSIPDINKEIEKRRNVLNAALAEQQGIISAS